MHIPVTCAACGQSFRVDAVYAGRRGKCPNPECQHPYTVPNPHSDRQEPPALKHDEFPAKSKSGRASLSWGQRTPSTVKKTGNRIVGRIDRFSFLVGAGLTAALGLFSFVFVSAFKKPSQAGETQTKQQAADKKDFSTVVLPVVKKYCGKCHSGKEPEAGISFEKYVDEAAMLKDRRTWERSFDMISHGNMPPADSPQPSPDEKVKLMDYLEKALFHIDCTQVTDPGRVTIRRLNRTEYNNTIRDLLGVAIRPADDFPSDDVGYGFDNIGDVLSLPPLLMEKYLDAAEKVAGAAIMEGDSSHPKVRRFSQNELHLSKAARKHDKDGVVIQSVGDVSVEMEFPHSGECSLQATAAEMPGGTEHSKMEFRLDGKALRTFEIKSQESKPQECEVVAQISRGKHRFSFAFLNDFYDPKAADKNRRDRNLIVTNVRIAGPINIAPSELPASHKLLLSVTPGPEKSAAVAARENLKPFLRRAFRRPVTEADLERFVAFVERAVTAGESFTFGMKVALTATLVSPHFLFRIESDIDPNNPVDKHPLNDFELASRLSYFLWSSMPDDELLSQAEQGDLHHDAVLDHQVRRMLKDPKSVALVDNFAEQWLQLRILNEVTPDPQRFPDYNPQLRDDMRLETRRFFEFVMREDRSILEFLDGPYSFVNERMARFYGLAGIKGPEFQKVSLEGKNRGGLLTQASILTLTSNPDRTSPVKRGKWVMEVILDQPPPPPPPNVPELAETAKAAPTATLRQQLELHRQNATCNSCHRVMDQLGFGMENFDAIGRWREEDNGKPVDASGELPGGVNFNGPVELTRVLRRKQCEFGGCLAEKMLTYALGRGLEFYDRCATDKIVRSLKEQEFRFSVLVAEIAKSEPFRMRRGEEKK